MWGQACLYRFDKRMFKMGRILSGIRFLFFVKA